MPDLNSMQGFELVFWLLVYCFLFGLYTYIICLLIKFLRRGIRFFDHQELDRNYRQWLARQPKNDSEKNG